MNTRLLHFAHWRIGGLLGVFIVAAVGFCFLLAVPTNRRAAGLASVSIVAYTNVFGARHVILSASNGHPWAIELAAGMPEIKNSIGWHDLWTNLYDYRTTLELKGSETFLFTQPVPTNPEPTRIRFLCYRADTPMRKVLRDRLGMLGIDVYERRPYKVYSQELAK